MLRARSRARTGPRRPKSPESAAAMRPAAFALLPIFLLLVVPAKADLSSIVNKGIDYVSLDDVASKLGLKTERGVPVTTEILKDGAKPLAKFMDRSRDSDIGGLRVFMGDPVI